MKKNMIPLTYKQTKSYKEQKVCYICKRGFSVDDDNKKYLNVIIIILENIVFVI